MELNFRKLRADEIELRISQINKGGITLLAYKDARCDQNILDESVGPMNWQRHHTRENCNCIVSIYDAEKNAWVEKEDTGTESYTEKEKGLASDSFKRACFNWGIGRELYTCPNIFIPRDKAEITERNGKDVCLSSFKCAGVTYNGNRIETITVDIYKYQNKTGSLVFGKAKPATTQPVQKANPAPTVQTSQQAPTSAKPSSVQTQVNSHTAMLRDDEIILMGNCRNKKYGEVKNSDQFKSFLAWASKSETHYTDEATAEQFARIKMLAAIA